MKAIVTCFVPVLFCLPGFCQLQQPDSSMQATQRQQQWLNSMYSMGVETKNDSFYIKEEAIRLFKDSVYRKIAYPERYEWTNAVGLLKKMELKTAFWHLINLYRQDTANRSPVVSVLLAYDSVMQMDKILVSTFYTYAFADPRVSRIVNNKPDIFRPDLLEEGLKAVKEIVGYLWYYRQRK